MPYQGNCILCYFLFFEITEIFTQDHPNMASQFDREAVIYVWNYGGPSHPGHAAMKIRGVVGAPKSTTYISFWPGEGAGLSNALKKQPGSLVRSHWLDKYNEMGESTAERLEDGTFVPNNLQQRKDMSQVNDDGDTETVSIWMQKPHHKIYIPGMGATGTKAGLNLVQIYEWFQIFSNSPGLKYKFASKKINCSGVVLLGLLKGGAAAFATKPTANLFIDPNQVRKFAEAVQRSVADINANASGLEIQAARTLAPKFRLDLSMELITLTDWKTKTQLGRFTGRSHVSDIDDAIKAYHLGKMIATQRIELLGKVLKAVRKHIMKYPESRRGGPVLELGKQALSLVEFNVGNFGLQQPSWYGEDAH